MGRFASGSIAGVDLLDGALPLRVDVLDGEAFRSTMIASSVVALDLTVHVQVLPMAQSGIHFGIKAFQMPVSVLSAIVTAAEAAMLGGDSFEVSLSDPDGVDSIACLAIIDYAALGGKAYTRGSFSSFYVKDVTMRFVSVGPQP